MVLPQRLEQAFAHTQLLILTLFIVWAHNRHIHRRIRPCLPAILKEQFDESRLPMSYSELIPYLPTVIGVLLLVMYGFMRREVAKSLPAPEASAKATLIERLQAFLRLSAVEAGLATSTKRLAVVLALTSVAYAAAIGAWGPEVTGWSGLSATWWWLLIALGLNLVYARLRLRELRLRAHAVAQLKATEPQALEAYHLFADDRWYAQLGATGKYLIAAIICFMIAVVCAMCFW